MLTLADVRNGCSHKYRERIRDVFSGERPEPICEQEEWDVYTLASALLDATRSVHIYSDFSAESPFSRKEVMAAAALFLQKKDTWIRVFVEDSGLMSGDLRTRAFLKSINKSAKKLGKGKVVIETVPSDLKLQCRPYLMIADQVGIRGYDNKNATYMTLIDRPIAREATVVNVLSVFDTIRPPLPPMRVETLQTLPSRPTHGRFSGLVERFGLRPRKDAFGRLDAG